MLNSKLSVASAKRCIDSAKKFNIDVDIQKAIVPSDNPYKIMEDEGINSKNFKNNIYSKTEPSMCCFLSHRLIWQNVKEDTLVLEHDSIVVSPIPKININKIVNVGKPSYGSFLHPNSKTKGLYKLFSKVGGYLPGTHGYIVSPEGAKSLVEKSYDFAEPADIYMNNKRFPEIEEYFPWFVEADDSFSFVQKKQGCLAKHNYNDNFKII